MAEAWSGLWPYVVVIVGAAATYVWRALGVMLSGRVPTESPIFEWVGCVAYALLAGLVARMILLPTGPLQGTGLAVRLAAAAIAVTVFFLTKRNILAGIAAGAATLVLVTARLNV